MNTRAAGGYSLLEVVFVAGLGATLTAAAVPQVLTGLDDHRTSGAARYIAARLQRARMEAVMRSAIVALQFTQTSSGYSYAEYVDGNRNGVLASEMQSGVDWRHGAIERLTEQFTGVDFGVVPGLPPIDPGGTPPGADPIRLGAANRASFSPRGTATPGTVYIRGRDDAQYAVRIFGETGKTRLLKFDRRNRRWRPI
jgi:type II secretory pathway pseudopilin PulG